MIAMRIAEFRKYMKAERLNEHILIMYRNKVIGEYRPRLGILECGVDNVEIQCAACGGWTRDAEAVLDGFGDERAICRVCFNKAK